MVAIARELEAQVQGEEDEIYSSGHEAPVHRKLSVLDRLRNGLRALRPAPRLKRIDPPFNGRAVPGPPNVFREGPFSGFFLSRLLGGLQQIRWIWES